MITGLVLEVGCLITKTKQRWQTCAYMAILKVPMLETNKRNANMSASMTYPSQSE